MRLRYPHLATSLALLLVLSQWLGLAHATEHVLAGQDGGCDVCTLQNHHHGTAVNISANAVSLPELLFDVPITRFVYPAVPAVHYGIRAPPLTLLN